DHAGRDAGPLELGEREVPRRGGLVREARPSDERARPIASARRLAAHELAPLDRVARSATRLGAAVVGDAALGADAGAGEHADAATAEQRDELVDVRGHAW